MHVYICYWGSEKPGTWHLAPWFPRNMVLAPSKCGTGTLEKWHGMEEYDVLLRMFCSKIAPQLNYNCFVQMYHEWKSNAIDHWSQLFHCLIVFLKHFLWQKSINVQKQFQTLTSIIALSYSMKCKCSYLFIVIRYCYVKSGIEQIDSNNAAAEIFLWVVKGLINNTSDSQSSPYLTWLNKFWNQWETFFYPIQKSSK